MSGEAEGSPGFTETLANRDQESPAQATPTPRPEGHRLGEAGRGWARGQSRDGGGSNLGHFNQSVR